MPEGERHRMDWGHWHLQEGLEPNAEAYGFVYRIDKLDPKDGEKKHYWGCKQMKAVKKMPPLKGKSRKRKKDCQTDWRTYYGSSNDLLADIAALGKDQFKGTILTFCSCKWQLKYEELKIQMQNNVLIRDDVYNGIVNVRINKVPKDLKKHYQSLEIL